MAHPPNTQRILAQALSQAVACHQQGFFAEAAQLYRGILKFDKNHFDALHLLGLIEQQNGNSQEAERLIRQALRIAPNSVPANSNYGVVQQSLGHLDLSQKHLERALALDPSFTDGWGNLAETAIKQGRLDEALANCDRALALDPNHFGALNVKGRALMHQSRHAEALACFDRALGVKVNAPDTLSNRGVIHQKFNRYDAARADYEKAIALDPGHVAALVNLGTMLHENGHYRDAIARYDAAIAVDPNNADAHFNKALAQICLGDFLAGWEKYEWRWKKANQRAEYAKFKQPRWLGDFALEGKRILIHAEQGLGDTLHFVRYVRDVMALGATVYLEIQKPLKSLLANVAGAAQVFAQGDALPAFDVHCPLLSLPHAMRTTKDTIPASVPYIAPPRDLAERWQSELRP